jgi:hypothetical protein
MSELSSASEKYKNEFIDLKMKENISEIYWELQNKFIDLEIQEK